MAIIPVAGIERLNAETDVRHKRRALTPEEVSRLVESARSSGCDVQGSEGELHARVCLMSFLTGLCRLELASQPDAPQLHSRCHSVHPESAGRLLEAPAGGYPADAPGAGRPRHGMDCRHGCGHPLFPRLDHKKTWLMVKLDLERIGIPYETPEGIADFHAAGRHSHVTGLLRNGATLVEAKELARHADVRMTMKHTHTGLEDQAAALAGLPIPKICTFVNGPGIGRESGVVPGHQVSADG